MIVEGPVVVAAPGIFEHRVDLDRLHDAEIDLDLVGHRHVFADLPVGRAGGALPVEIGACVESCAACLWPGCFHTPRPVSTMISCDAVLQIQSALVDRVLHKVAAKRGKCRLRAAVANRGADDLRGVAIRPTAAARPVSNRLARVAQGLRHPAAAARTASIISSSGSLLVVGSSLRCSTWATPTSTGVSLISSGARLVVVSVVVLVAGEGLEPSLGCPNWILNPARLPISPPSRRADGFCHIVWPSGQKRRSHCSPRCDPRCTRGAPALRPRCTGGTTGDPAPRGLA